MIKRVYYWLWGRWRDLRADLRSDEAKGKHALVTWPREGSPDLFYIFQGRGRLRGEPVRPPRGPSLTMDPLTFLRATGLTDANLVMLRDPNKFFYHAGVNAELRSFDAVLERLRACREGMPHVQRAFCLGSSMGGYAALLFGHYLGVDTVYAFAPQTLLDLPRLGAMVGRKDTWRFPDAHRDLALLLGEYNGRTRYKVFYCEGSAIDRAFAERLRDCRGVELYPQPGDTHGVIQEMYERGRLSEAIVDR